ncbi:hypothetical protein JI735_34120 (plasmid) [Paenibacillus sonchi]|uniref:Uncharacterized protein n=1 Tax=Paenibacillus sonchi TaxID=373687 RepID=A0A974PJ16_9BACL|nr:hypothetical protein [Paenibacillus sonchi]QQZ64478.1 hypothetical protein JI735_34120 [Paenibacillus sonchi]
MPILIFVLEKAAEAFGAKAAEIIISEVVEGLAARISGDLFRKSVEEICARVQKIIDDAFFERDLASSRSITRRFFEFENTRDFEILDELYGESTTIIENLMPKVNSWEGYLATVQLMAVALLVIAGLSEKNADYKKVLITRGKYYSEWVIPKADLIVQLAEQSVTPIRAVLPESLGKDYRIYDKECPIDKTKACYAYQYAFFDLWRNYDSAIPLHEHTGTSHYYISKYWDGKIVTPEFDEKDPDFRLARKLAIQSTSEKREAFLNKRLNEANKTRSEIIRVCQVWNRV